MTKKNTRSKIIYWSNWSLAGSPAVQKIQKVQKLSQKVQKYTKMEKIVQKVQKIPPNLRDNGIFWVFRLDGCFEQLTSKLKLYIQVIDITFNKRKNLEKQRGTTNFNILFNVS